MPNGTDALSALILAGPNEAGKTTFARELLGTGASTLTFLNADIIAAELSPGAPERAAMEAALYDNAIAPRLLDWGRNR